MAGISLAAVAWTAESAPPRGLWVGNNEVAREVTGD
jgi:hypothetical protein